MKARNTQRISDLTQIRKALEMYYSDNRTYPVSSTIYATECTRTGESAYKVTNQNMIPSLVPLYISKIPTDPSFVAGSGNNCYYYRSNGTDYAFFNVYVNDSGMDYKNYPAFYDPNRDGGANTSIIDGTTPTSWKVYTPGGASW